MGAVAVGGHEGAVGPQAHDLALRLGGARGRGGCRFVFADTVGGQEAAHIGEGADEGGIVAEPAVVEDLFQCVAAEPLDGAPRILQAGVVASAPVPAKLGFAVLAFMFGRLPLLRARRCRLFAEPVVQCLRHIGGHVDGVRGLAEPVRERGIVAGRGLAGREGIPLRRGRTSQARPEGLDLLRRRAVSRHPHLVQADHGFQVSVLA